MIRGFFRFLGLLCLAGAFIFVVYDGARSIADNTIKLYKFEQAWSDINQASLASLQPLLETRLGNWAWDPTMKTILDQPLWLILGILGIILLFIGRKKKPLIGYARS